jgi:hypothetical protein
LDTLSYDNGNDLNIGVSGMDMRAQKLFLLIQQHHGGGDDHQPGISIWRSERIALPRHGADIKYKLVKV